MKKAMKFPPHEVREREHQGKHDSRLAAIRSIATKTGRTAKTLRRWIWQSEKDDGQREGTTFDRSLSDSAMAA